MPALAALGFVVLIGCAHSTDVRSRLLQSAREQDPDFPDGEEIQLTRFAYIGSVETPDGPVYVVERLAVITGMLAPRGIPKLDFYDRDYNLLGSYSWPGAKPLWCEGSRVYLFGYANHWAFPVDLEIRGLFARDEARYGNVIEFRDGFDRAFLKLEKRYGSSGGVDDDPYRELRKRTTSPD